MRKQHILLVAAGLSVAALMLDAPAHAGTTVQVGDSGKSYASAAIGCSDLGAGQQAPSVEVGLFNPKRGASATVSIDGTVVATVTADQPATYLRLADGPHAVVVALSKKVADSYAYDVTPGLCATGNWFSPDGTLEYAASGKSYATVTPGCAFNGATGRAQWYVNLFDSGGYLLNVSVNGTPLTQLSASHPHTPVFLGAGPNTITAANGSLSVDTYVRDGGQGVCTLP